MSEKLVIIGATGGIGSFVAQLLSEKGSQLHLIARGTRRLEELATELKASFSTLDASSFESLEKDLSNVADKWGPISGIVNCAGSVLLKPAHLTSQAEYEDIVTRNLTTAFSTVRAAGKFIENGSIVLCSTAAVRVGLQNHEAIAASKGGVEALVRSAAATYSPKGIRVNAVAPGLTRTPMTRRIVDNEDSLRVSTAMHALGRIGEPRDVASAIFWLLDDSQSWVTGQIIAIDGGLSSVVPPRAARS